MGSESGAGDMSRDYEIFSIQTGKLFHMRGKAAQ